ncbi:MAG: phosphoenolpyruvate synthase, partial [Clostridiales Family XIII bacterium]|nr:phosphoenolpyruvate synthase [Clostridiales Family XIII bacterium]
MINQKKAFSGLTGLDEALDYMRYGDIVVWQVSDIDNYRFFAGPFVERALAERKNVVYFRFGKHSAIMAPTFGITIYEIDVDLGFESVVMSISDIIEKEGNETHYVFDNMTDLQVEWVADFMMGNFFVVTAPEILRTNSIAYFAYTRNHHSFESIARIRETASILVDVVPGEKHMYLQPLKVLDRYLPTIFLPHRVEIDDKDSLRPLTNGIELARYYSLVAQNGNVDSAQNLDNWDLFFMEKKADFQEGADTGDLRELCRLVFGTDEHILDIAVKNVELKDLLDIKARMIGVGSIGGKATGMILSRMVVEKKLPEMSEILEPHDSFYVCSNLYYTFL